MRINLPCSYLRSHLESKSSGDILILSACACRVSSRAAANVHAHFGHRTGWVPVSHNFVLRFGKWRGVDVARSTRIQRPQRHHAPASSIGVRGAEYDQCVAIQQKTCLNGLFLLVCGLQCLVSKFTPWSYWRTLNRFLTRFQVAKRGWNSEHRALLLWIGE